MLFFFETSLVIFIGLVLGSFSTALTYRIPRKLSWGAVRSACPNCKAVLGVFDLFPVISWCMSFGKCRHCSNKISYKYPAIELVSALLCLGIYWIYGFSIASLLMMACVPILIALFLIDLEYLILPNQLVFILFILALLRLVYSYIYDFSVILNDWLVQYIGGAIIYAGLTWAIGFVLTKILKRNSLGFGDVKFFLVSGLWLGLYMLPYFMILSGSIAILFALLWKFFKKEDIFPFGPALIISFYVLLLFQGSFYYQNYIQ